MTIKSRWRKLDLSEKLGYAWLVSFVILVLATAAAILVPVYLDYLEERAAEEAVREEGGDESRLEAPPPALPFEVAEDGSWRLHRLTLPTRGLSGESRPG